MIVDSQRGFALPSAVARGAALHSRLVQETLPPPPVSDEPGVFNRLSRLPALRPSTLKLLSISVDSESALSEFENVFRSDPVLAADLLILANSPAFGVRATVHIIRHAMALLGMERIRSLAFAVAVKGYLRTGRWAQELQVSWRHSIATAVVAEALGAALQVEQDHALPLAIDQIECRLDRTTRAVGEIASFHCAVLWRCSRCPLRNMARC